MKKLLLCTMIITLLILENVMPKLLTPEKNPKVLELTMKMDNIRQKINRQKINFSIEQRNKLVGKSGKEKEMQDLDKKIQDLNKELFKLFDLRQKLLEQLHEEYDKLVKKDVKEDINN